MTTLEKIDDLLAEAEQLLADELGDVGDNARYAVRKARAQVDAIPECCTEADAARANAAVIALRHAGWL